MTNHPDQWTLPESLRNDDVSRYRQWIEQLQTALPDIDDVVTVERPDTRHRYLQVVYRGGFVIEPELEAWVWANSSRVADVLGWERSQEALREFLNSRQLWDSNALKPSDPNEALRLSLRCKRKPLGARLFSEIAATVSLQSCEDPAFVKLRQRLRKWFRTNADNTR
ncbi:MAG: hypothetical protein FJ297_06635 [Planctomycetes bacterium]|nr:hypothetical protein [Planctomycetota bacterium]